MKNQSADQQKKHYDERVAQIKNDNAKVEAGMKAHEAQLKERLEKFKIEKDKPLPPSSVDYSEQIRLA